MHGAPPERRGATKATMLGDAPDARATPQTTQERQAAERVGQHQLTCRQKRKTRGRNGAIGSRGEMEAAHRPGEEPVGEAASPVTSGVVRLRPNRGTNSKAPSEDQTGMASVASCEDQTQQEQTREDSTRAKG